MQQIKERKEELTQVSLVFAFLAGVRKKVGFVASNSYCQ
jgi:hypothetical protein